MVNSNNYIYVLVENQGLVVKAFHDIKTKTLNSENFTPGLTKLPDEDDEVTNFTQHFSKELLIEAGVNFAALENEDLRCGGVVLSSNKTSSSTYSILKELAADCIVQKCTFR